MGIIVNPFLQTPVIPGNGLLTDLLAYYELDEPSGNRLDSHINGFTLTQVGTVGYDAIEECADFSGASGNYLDSGGVFNFNSVATYNYWINIDTASNAGFFQVGSNNFSISLAAGNYYARIDGTNLSSSVPIPVATWTMVTIMYDGANILIFEDGIQVANLAKTGTTPFTAESLFLGRQETRYLNGRMKDFGFWNINLATDQITALYNSGTPLPYASFTA